MGNAGLVDAAHDFVKFGINFFGSPRDVHGVLGHLQTGSRHSSGIHRLPRSEHDAGALEGRDRSRSATHIGNLGT